MQYGTKITHENFNKETVNVESIWKQKPLNSWYERNLKSKNSVNTQMEEIRSVLHFIKWYLIVQEFCLSRSMRYAALAFRTLSLLDSMSSSGISVMSLAEWSSVRKCSETVVGLEGGLSTQWRIQCRARSPLFSDKTEAWRAKKKIFGDPPQLSKGLDDRGATHLFSIRIG